MASWRSLTPQRRARTRGFTLVEMMIVVAVVGILAALAVYGVRKYVMAAKSSEAWEMIRAIKAAQETYRSETFTYVDVSASNSLANLDTFYPTKTPGQVKYMWGGGTDAVAVAWRPLNIQTDQPLQYAYGCAAGDGTLVPAGATITAYGKAYMGDIGNWPAAATGEPWYVVKAVGDLDGDGENASVYVAASFTAEIFNNTDAD